MINIASKAGSYLRATNQVVANGLKPLAGAALAEKKVTTENREVSSVYALTQALPACNVYVRSGVTSKYINKIVLHPYLQAIGNIGSSQKLYNP